ncbi:type II secretion system F family protein [Herminiimonas sp.]|uniref:type II secretion system F family protein n=1 Tax=Herminiimonas sp. TaxID=1926289 RepID=UPI002726B7A9|nr:type II secretion system F family protein [Herminiimonas sp.]MDO8305305.1 type II secretion system F family protein [Herminiimonas sp.]
MMPSNSLIALLIGIATGITVLLISYSLSKLKSEVPREEREYMDPLPPVLKLSWPVITFIEYHFCSRLPPSWLEQTHKRLQETGVGYILTAEQYYAVRVFSTIVAFILTLFSLHALDYSSPGTLVGVTLLGNFYPQIWLRDVRARREKEILKALPVYLDFITQAVEAGLNLTGAIKQAMDKGPAGALRNEFQMISRDLRAGVPRADALRRMEKRLNMKAITSFVGTVIQAEKMGASVGAALRVQSQQRRIERFQRAEKLAMEAPVKLILPLIAFIFPVTFIVLAFPIVIKFMQEGML